MTALAIVALLTFLAAALYRYRRQQAKYISPDSYADEKAGHGHASQQTSSPHSDPVLQALIPADEHRVSRGDWVARMVLHVYNARYGGRYNVLAMNKAVSQHFVPEDVVEQFSVDYISCKERGTVVYQVTVFRQGHLVNLGDGGYINWCFEGNFERSEKIVDFRPVE